MLGVLTLAVRAAEATTSDMPGRITVVAAVRVTIVLSRPFVARRAGSTNV